MDDNHFGDIFPLHSELNSWKELLDIVGTSYSKKDHNNKVIALLTLGS